MIIKYTLYFIGICILVYILSRIHAAAWIHAIEKFLNNQKHKENDKKKKKPL